MVVMLCDAVVVMLMLVGIFEKGWCSKLLCPSSANKPGACICPPQMVVSTTPLRFSSPVIALPSENIAKPCLKWHPPHQRQPAMGNCGNQGNVVSKLMNNLDGYQPGVKL